MIFVWLISIYAKDHYFFSSQTLTRTKLLCFSQEDHCRLTSDWLGCSYALSYYAFICPLLAAVLHKTLDSVITQGTPVVPFASNVALSPGQIDLESRPLYSCTPLPQAL